MTEPFPERLQHFRMDRKRTWGDVIDDNPEDWAWYVRADLHHALEMKLAAAQAEIECWKCSDCGHSVEKGEDDE